MRHFIENEPTSPVNYRYRVKRVLFRGKSRFQRILVFESPFHGRVLALDNIVQLTMREEHFYHEMLVHPIMQAHPNPRRVLIVGGGDGGSLCQVVKYPSVERIVECELDEKVVAVAKRYLPRLGAGFRDSRVQVLNADGREYLRETGERFDAIILDLTDPIGPAKPLFQRPFYRLCADHLADDGFLSAQTESLHFHKRTVKAARIALERVFPIVELATIPLSMYPGNWWTISVASKSLDPKVVRNKYAPSTRIYERQEHAWFFVPPGVISKTVGHVDRRSYEKLT